MEENTIRDLLSGEIQRTLVEVSQVTASSEESKAYMQKLNMLYGKYLEEESIDLKERSRLDESYDKGNQFSLRKQELDLREKELEQKMAQFMAEADLRKKELEQREAQFAAEKKLREEELEQKMAEIKGSKADRWINILLTVFSVSVPLGFSSYWMARGMEFEETGTYTGRTGPWISQFMRLFGKKG